MKELVQGEVNSVLLKDDVEKIKKLMLQEEQVDLEVNHHYAESLYGRQGWVRKGVMAIGHEHTKDSINV